MRRATRSRALRFLRRAMIVALALCGPASDLRAAPGLGDLEATRQRPLFAPSRRPPPRPPAAAASDPAAPAASEVRSPAPNLELYGVIVGHDRRVAIVKHPQDARTIDLSIGDTIDGWVVQTIEARSIVLRQAFRSVALDMHEPGR